jgi:hypothetical protein
MCFSPFRKLLLTSLTVSVEKRDERSNEPLMAHAMNGIRLNKDLGTQYSSLLVLITGNCSLSGGTDPGLMQLWAQKAISYRTGFPAFPAIGSRFTIWAAVSLTFSV